jgi:hypothetical protein
MYMENPGSKFKAVIDVISIIYHLRCLICNDLRPWNLPGVHLALGSL